MKTYFCLFLVLFSCLGTAQPTTMQTQLISLATGQKLSPAEMDEFMQRWRVKYAMPGLSVAIINGDAIVYHQTLGVRKTGTTDAVTATTLFDAASLSKPVFAYLTLRLVEQGLLDLDKPLYTYLPYPDIAHDERYKLINARMVLSHRSGFPNWRFGKPLEIKFTPGTDFQYSGEGYEYLALVIAHLKGIDKNQLDELFKAEVANPLGMTQSTTVWTPYLAQHQASGHIAGEPNAGWGIRADRPNFMASYSLNTEAYDYAHFLLALINVRGLSSHLFKQMFSIQAENTRSTPHRFWGLGLEIKQGKQDTKYLHSGSNDSFSAYFEFIQDKGFGYVFFTNCEKAFEANKELEVFLTGDY